MLPKSIRTLKLRWKFCTLTFLYGAVLRWHHSSRPSLAVISSTEMSWMANRRMMVQIMPSVIFRLPSTISSAPIDTNLTPFDAMKSRALLTLAIYIYIPSEKANPFTIYNFNSYHIISTHKPCGNAFCRGPAWAVSRRKWLPAAAWVWGHYGSHRQCCQWRCQPCADDCCTKLWMSTERRANRETLIYYIGQFTSI